MIVSMSSRPPIRLEISGRAFVGKGDQVEVSPA
jgi:hypothetical protein